MIGTLFRWFRRTLPPAWAVGMAIFLLLFMEGLYLWMRWYIIIPEVAAEMSEKFLRMRDGFAAMIMAWYGIFRVMAFHPLFRPNYRAWLEQTPWTSQKTLPLGPIHLIWQDVVLLGLVMLSLHGSTLGRLWPLESFLFAYLVFAGLSFWRTGPWWMGYVIFFGLALAIRTILHPLITLPILISIYAVAAFGLRLALSRFPWPSFQTFDEFARSLRKNNSSRQRPISISFWPLCQPGDVCKINKVNRHDGILFPLLTAWWMYALASNIQKIEDQRGFLGVQLIVLAGVALIVRLFMYMMPCVPPTNVWGRIITCRWIIPGYDQVLYAPICMVFVGILGALTANIVGAKYCLYIYPLSTAAVLFIAFNMGPSLRKWQLTGHYRMTPLDINTKETNRIKL